MDAEHHKRAEARRRRMWGGVATSHEQLDELDPDCWLSVAPAERIRAACLLHEEARRWRNEGPSPSLRTAPGGVRRLGS